MNRRTGDEVEDRALAYLLARGLTLIARNYHCRRGEIDLIMRHGDNLVFVEVRYRRQARFGSALESVDVAKQARILHCARHFLLAHPQIGEPPCRFDVIGITGEQGTIQWLENAFGA